LKTITPALLLLTLAACTGEAPLIFGSETDGGWLIPDMPSTCAATRPPSVRLLTNAEVDATLEAVFSTPSPIGGALPGEVLADGYSTNVDREVGSFYVDTIDTQSAALSRTVAPVVGAGLACQTGEAEEACVSRALGALGRQLWRRPLEAGELDELMAVFRAARPAGTRDDALAVAVQALVGAPSFLYRRELGAPDGDALTLTADEIAEAMAYDFTGGPPDQALLEVAAAGALADPARREQEAQRLLETPAGRAHLARFTTEWLKTTSLPSVSRDPTRFPAYSDPLRDAMVEETRRFAEDVFYGPAPTAKTLWGADYTYANGALAAFYGLDAQPDAGFQKVDLGPTKRRGFLGQAGVLLSHSHDTSTSPVKRGVLVLSRAICRPPPPPPPNVVFMTGTPDDPKTTRERYSQHDSNPSCAGCHRSIDPPGFALEGFDPIGADRTEEHGFPVDTTAVLIAAGQASGPVTGSVDLATHVSESQDAADCLVSQLGSYELGKVAGADEACVLQQMRHRSLTQGGDAMEALRALVGSDAYITRKVVP